MATSTTGAMLADEALPRYRRAVRVMRLPFVRVYSVVLILVALAYIVVNPWFLEGGEVARLSTLIGSLMLVSGLYAASTWWDRYPEFPAIDAAALLGMAMLVTGTNVILFDHLIEIHEAMHAVGVINRLAVAAFAAVVLAGHQRLFYAWMAADLAIFLFMVLPLQHADAGLWFALLSYASGAIVMVCVNLAVDRSGRRAFMLAEALEAERARNEELVHNMLPAAAVARIRDGNMVADSYADASVIFIDMAGFSALSKRVSPGHLVEVLNAFFGHADRCTAACKVEKVKTVGDAYLAIAGGTTACLNSADSAIAFAEAVLGGLDELSRRCGIDVALRVGIHSGPVVGGVIGATRMAYDYWGDTVNVAARLEAVAPLNGIAVSESTWLRTGRRDLFGPPSVEMLKGVGEITIFRSLAGRAEPAAPARIIA